MPKTFIAVPDAISGNEDELTQVGGGKLTSALYVWDPVGLAWTPMTQPSSVAGGGVTIADGADVAQGAKADAAWDGIAASSTVVAILKRVAVLLSSGGGGGPATIADGADVTQGAKADAAWDGVAAAPTAQGISKYLSAKVEAMRALLAGTLTVVGTVGVSNFPATQPVSGPLTDTQLRASAVPVSSASLPLPAGASTGAKQDTGNASVASIDTKTPALGQALAAASVPVVLTAAQVAAITPPAAIAGFALEAGHLATIDTSTAKIPAQGQALAAASMPVVLPAAQITTLTPPAAITGFALEAGHLAAIDTHLDVALSTRLKPADTLAGVTTVAAVTAITNPLPAGTNTLGKVDQGVANATPWNENIAQIGGSAIAAKALPTGGAGQTAIPVYINAIQLLTYTFGARAIVTGALTANTAKAILSLEVAAGNTKTVRIRRILISGIQTTLLAGLLDIQVNRGSAASSAGTGVTAGVRVTGDAAPSTVVKTLPTIVAGAVLDTLPFAAAASAAVSAQPATVLFDWQEGGETKPWTLKPSVIDSLVLMAISTAAQNWTLTVHVTVTEE